MSNHELYQTAFSLINHKKLRNFGTSHARWKQIKEISLREYVLTCHALSVYALSSQQSLKW